MSRRRLLQQLAAVVALMTWLFVVGPAWIYGLRDGNATNDDGAQARGPVGDVLDMVKAGWEEVRFPLVLFLVGSIALAAHRFRRGHDDAREEIKGKVMAIPLVIFMIPIAY